MIRPDTLHSAFSSKQFPVLVVYLEDHPSGCKWLVTMVSCCPLSRVVGPLPNGLNGVYMGVTNHFRTGMILQVSSPKTNCSPLKVYKPFQKGRLVSICHHFSGAKNVSFRNPCTLLGTLKMIFLFQWWDILVPWSLSHFYWRLNSFYL